MKPVRLLLISLGVLLVLSAVALGLVLTPSVQRWAVLRAAREVPGLKLEVATVSGGFSGVALRGVRAEQRQVVVQLERAEVDFSLLGYLFGHELALSRLHAEGVSVDASRLSPARTEAAAAGTPVASPGLLAQVVLPFDLKLDNVRIAGRALLPVASGQPPVEVDYTVSGGGFAAGKEGLLQVNATLRNPAPDARVATLRAQAGLRATLTPQRTFNNVSLTTVVDAEGRGLAGQTQLKVGTEFFHTSRGEHYEVVVSTLLQGVAENALILRAQLPVASRRYAGEWEMKVRTAQLEPFSLGGALPLFDARGGGRFAFDAAEESFSLEGDLQGAVDRLELVDPAWRAFGRLKVDTTFDLNQHAGRLDLKRFQALISGDAPVLEARTTAAIRYDLKKGELLPAEALETGGLLHVTLHGLPLAWLRPFLKPADVSGGMITGELDVVRARDSVTAATVRGKLQVADLNLVHTGQALLTKAAVTAQAEATLAGGAVDAPRLDLAVTTPAGETLSLNGRLTARTGEQAPVTFTGRFSAATAQLLARWLPGGPVRAEGDLDLTWQGTRLDVRPSRFELRQDSNRPLLTLTVRQPFGLDLTSRVLTPQNPAQPVARLELGRLPLGLLPVTQPDTVLGGYVAQGDFELAVSGEKMLFRALAPFRLADVSLTERRQVQLTGLTVEALPSAEYAAGGLQVVSGDVTVRTAAKATLLTLKAEVGQTPGRGSQAVVAFALEVPVLASQPLFVGAQAVTAGRATGEIRAVVGSHSQLEARMTVNGLIAAEGGQTLPVANLSFRGLVQPNGAISVQAPLLLDNAGRRSDLNFALELSPLGHGYSVDGRLTGQQVELQDLLGVIGVFSAAAVPDSGEQAAPVTVVGPDTTAAWSRFSGHLALDLKSVTRGQDWAMTGLSGMVTLEPALLSLQKLEAAFSENSRLAAKAELRFTGGSMPYRLAGDYTLSEFDAGRLFKALEPGKPPTVEGLFNVNAKFSGNGETPGRAIDRLQGEFVLTSRQGVFRGLQRTTSKVSMTSKAVELGASVLGSLFGSEKVTKTAEKVAGQAYFVDQLAQGIGEFNYDLLSVRLSRDELLNMNLEDISLMSPEIRLTGRGAVSYVVGKPLLEQPLTASLVFSARGKTEQLLDKLSALDGTKDELGYARTKAPVTLGGTLTKPDPTGFFTRLASAKLADFLDSER